MENGIGLAQVIEEIRGELLKAVNNSKGKEIVFPVGDIDLEFHVGVEKSKDGKGGIKVWVFEIGGGGSHRTENTHTIRMKLGQPIYAMDGTSVEVACVDKDR